MATFFRSLFSIQWLNSIGVLIFIFMMIPNIIYGARFKNTPPPVQNKVITILEQIGRYGCFFFLVFRINFFKLGTFFPYFFIYVTVTAILLIAYWIFWVLFFRNQTLFVSMALAIFPTCIFLISGVFEQNILFVIFAILFGISHIQITYKNQKVSS